MKFRSLALALLCFAAVQMGATASAIAAGQSASKPQATKKAVHKTASAKKKFKAKAKVKTKKVSRKPAVVQRAMVAEDDLDELRLDAAGNPLLRSSAFYVANEATGEILLEKNSDAVLPIASITKLMTAMVVLDAAQSLSEPLTVTVDDIDTLKGTGSRLAIGTVLTREEMLHLALMSSENRAASALARHYPGGRAAFIEAMNAKARLLDMRDTRFYDSTGLNPANVSSPRDLARLVSASGAYPLIREFSTSPERYVEIRGRQTRFANTNSLVRSPEWDIRVSKTGYISEAGRCLVMQARLLQQQVVIVLMDSVGRYTRTADAQRVRKWLETAGARSVVKVAGQQES